MWQEPSLLWPAGLAQGQGSLPGCGNKWLLQLSSLSFSQSLHKSHIHCSSPHPLSWQNSLGPQGSAGTEA